MKKVLALLLCLMVALSFCACGKADTASSDSAPTVAETDGFEKPSNYASVIVLKINPQFELYLDENNDVLAVHALNDDAKSFEKDLDLTDKGFDKVIANILKNAKDRGFLKTGATVSFEATEKKVTTINLIDVLTKASAAANQAATELELTLNVNTENKVKDSDAADTSSETETPNQPTGNQGGNTPAKHTHKYVGATCTKSGQCACGSINAALGHTWQNATCKTPKKCITCGFIEGTKGEHSYKDGVCTVCGQKENKVEEVKPQNQNLNPKTHIKWEQEYVSKRYRYWDLEKTAIYSGGFCLYNDEVDGLYCLVLEATFEDAPYAGRKPVNFNGKNYYRCGAGQNPHRVELTDTEIIIKNCFWEEEGTITAKMVLQTDGNLKVTYSNSDLFRVDEILSIDWNYLS